MSRRGLTTQLEQAHREVEDAAANWLDKKAAGKNREKAQERCQQARESVVQLENALKSKSKKKRK